MNYGPNTRQWEIGDVVIHDADAKRADMLMRVIGYDPKTGLCRTIYQDQTAHPPKRRCCPEVFENRLAVLLDPRYFGLGPEGRMPTPEEFAAAINGEAQGRREGAGIRAYLRLFLSEVHRRAESSKGAQRAALDEIRAEIGIGDANG